MSFSIIAAIGKNRELGKKGQLIFHLPGDMKFFREKTTGHPIVMGRKTFESLPKMLPGRRHYVVSRNCKFSDSATKPGLKNPEDLVLINDLESFARDNQGSNEEFFVIGGGALYTEMLGVADKLYLTEVEAEDTEADTFFPEFDKTSYKRTVLGKGQDNGIDYTFVQYSK